MTRRSTPIGCTWALAALFLGACDFAHFAPELADLGGDTVHVEVGVGAQGSAGEEVQALTVEVFDVELRRADDKGWMLVNDVGRRVELEALEDGSFFRPVPLNTGVYDRARLTIGRVTVEAGGFELEASSEATLELDVSLGVYDSGQVEFVFLLDGALTGSAVEGWTFAPSVTALETWEPGG